MINSKNLNDDIPNDENHKNETHNRFNDDEDTDDDYNSIASDDSLLDYIDFQSHRNSSGLEESISFTFPLPQSTLPSSQPIVTTPPPRRLTLSTLLEEDDLAPLFDGAGWAGTRVWSAAIWAARYIVDHYGRGSQNRMSLCELGCGLGVPGMVWHQFGGDVVLTDQESIMSQLDANVRSNFPDTFVSRTHFESDKDDHDDHDDDDNCRWKSKPIIQTYPLTWSRSSLHTLLNSTSYPQGFDIILNCDCVYEPLYGKSWEALVEVIDEALRINPRCVVVTSVERRASDGIGDFLERMREAENVGAVDRVEVDEGRDLELYVTKGVC